MWDDNQRSVINYAGWVGGPGDVGYTADVTFTDSLWNDIGNEYPAGATMLYLQVYDPDVSGSVDVLVTSDTDTSGETVTLTEVSTGLFQGTLSVNLSSFKIIDNKDQYAIDVETRMHNLSVEHSDWDEDQLKARASAEVYNEYFERACKRDIRTKSTNMSLEDGVLQVSTGDIMVMTYEDATNDYGNPETITDEAVYGGWSGNVSGTWTAANSPYVVTGDIYVDWNDSLTIEPGVEVKFLSNYRFDIYGYLYVVGTETDSIRFIPTDMSNPSAGMWEGIHIEGYRPVTMSYFVVAYGGTSQWPDAGLGVMYRYSDAVTLIENGEIYGSYRYGVHDYYGYGQSQTTYRNLRVHDNNSMGFDVREHRDTHTTLIEGCESYNNGSYGIQLSYIYGSSSVSVTNSDIHDNGSSEVYAGYFDVSNGAEYVFNHNNITDDDGWLVYTSCCWSELAGVEVDFRYNFWGDSTTAEMNAGDNPKNISTIYDLWDDNQRSVINYAGWLQKPAAAGVSLSIDELISSPGDTVLVGLNVDIPEDTSFISSEITISGYSGQLEFIEIVTDSSLIGSAEWSIQYNETDSLLITASAGADGITGEGVLFWLRFAIPDTASGFIPIILESAIFNTGEVPVKLNSGGINVLMDLIVDFEGTPLSGVYPLEVNFTDLSDAGTIGILSWLWTFGDGDTSDVQNPTHTYSFPGNYTVSLTITDTLRRVSSETKYDYINVPIMYGDVDFNTLVQAYDAGLILQYLVEYIDFNETQIQSGNVSLDTSLSALDASIILQYTVGLIDSLPYDTSYGLLSASGLISMNNIGFKPGESIALPLYLHDGNNILSFEGKFTSNPEIVSLDSIIWSDFLDDFVIEAAIDSGEFTFAAAGSSPDGQEGLFATVYLTVNDTFEGDSITISLEKLRLNEEPVIENIYVVLTKTLAIDNYMGIPTEFALSQNYPNPFNPVTTIQYQLPKSTKVNISIYNIMGQLVETLVDEYKEAGYYSVFWNASQVSSGMYFYKIVSGDFSDVKKCVILK